MDFSLTDEQKMIQQTVRQFVDRELMPLENEVLQNEGRYPNGIEPSQYHSLQMKAKEMGFWGINTPEEYGGANLGAVMTALIFMELGKTLVPFMFGGSADNILYHGNEWQKEEYLVPTVEGKRKSCFALTEPGAGSDPSAIRTTAVKDGNHWVINGQKVFITGGNEADFTMVFAVTDRTKPPQNGGVTCFLVDREMGWTSRPVPTMGGWSPAELFFENVRVPEDHVLGEVGNGFSLGMQWIGQGRWIIASRCVGTAGAGAAACWSADSSSETGIGITSRSDGRAASSTAPAAQPCSQAATSAAHKCLHGLSSRSKNGQEHPSVTITAPFSCRHPTRTT